jgi:cellulose biosynthesis protein BcsQ
MKVLATYNLKGGVGKTAAAVNLSYLAARDGLSTLLWDLDPQGAATFTFRIKPRVKGGSKALVGRSTPIARAIKGTDFDRLDLVPADFSYRNMDLHLDARKKPVRRLRRLLAPLADEYDVVILDCPPSISLVSESIMDAADLLLVPLIPATLSLRTFGQLNEFLREFDGRTPQVLGFFSMVDRRKRMHREVLASPQPAVRGAAIAKTAIPALAIIERMAEVRAPVTASAPRSVAAMCYADLWSEVRATLSLRGPDA